MAMYVMYVDESGDTGLIRSPTTHFVLSGLAVHESRWREFITILVGLRRTLRGVYGLPIRTEIHSTEFIGSRVMAVGRRAIQRHDRLAILRNSLDELAKINFICITN